MPEYRVYFIGRDGHFLGAIDIQAASDQHAIATALELREGHEVEVWESTRFVRRLSDPSPALPAPSLGLAPGIGCAIRRAPSRLSTLARQALSSLWRK